MPRIESYVDDTTYMKILEVRAKNHLKTNGKAAAYLLKMFFSMDKQQDAAVSRLTKVIQEQNNKIINLENQLKHEQMKKKIGAE